MENLKKVVCILDGNIENFLLKVANCNLKVEKLNKEKMYSILYGSEKELNRFDYKNDSRYALGQTIE